MTTNITLALIFFLNAVGNTALGVACSYEHRPEGTLMFFVSMCVSCLICAHNITRLIAKLKAL